MDVFYLLTHHSLWIISLGQPVRARSALQINLCCCFCFQTSASRQQGRAQLDGERHVGSLEAGCPRRSHPLTATESSAASKSSPAASSPPPHALLSTFFCIRHHVYSSPAGVRARVHVRRGAPHSGVISSFDEWAQSSGLHTDEPHRDGELARACEFVSTSV